MKDISDRIQEIPLSPIRKLTPLADEAKSRGIKVYHLNIGQPDIHTPEEGMDAMRKIDRKVLEYSPSQGFLSLRQRISEYYAGFGMKYSPDEIIVTTGASEAVLFSFITCMDPGDEIITTEPLKQLYDELDNNKYDFDYLGEKQFDGVSKPVLLYKILYN